MTPNEHDARFMRSVLAASDDCIKVIDLDGRLLSMSEGGQRVMEVSDFNAVKGCPWPDFWKGQGNRVAVASIEAAREGRSSRFQGAANTAAGNPRVWDVQVSPIFGPDGGVESILSVSRDITALHQAEERQRLLAQELKHRMNNTIAMIQAIANQTLKAGTNASIDEVRTNFIARLATLSAAHDLLTQADWARANIADVVRGSLSPHADLARFRIDGPDLELSSKCALALALALHELATNANKYGALTTDAGRIAVTWSVTDGVFRLVWQETGGPLVATPTRLGFGSRMIERALAGYFSARAEIAYAPSGLVFRLEAPLEALTVE